MSETLTLQLAHEQIQDTRHSDGIPVDRSILDQMIAHGLMVSSRTLRGEFPVELIHVLNDRLNITVKADEKDTIITADAPDLARTLSGTDEAIQAYRLDFNPEHLKGHRLLVNVGELGPYDHLQDPLNSPLTLLSFQTKFDIFKAARPNDVLTHGITPFHFRICFRGSRGFNARVNTKVIGPDSTTVRLMTTREQSYYRKLK